MCAIFGFSFAIRPFSRVFLFSFFFFSQLFQPLCLFIFLRRLLLRPLRRFLFFRFFYVLFLAHLPVPPA